MKPIDRLAGIQAAADAGESLSPEDTLFLLGMIDRQAYDIGSLTFWQRDAVPFLKDYLNNPPLLGPQNPYEAKARDLIYQATRDRSVIEALAKLPPVEETQQPRKAPAPGRRKEDHV